VTKSKKNRLFIVNGAEMHAEEIIQSGIKETVAQLPGYGLVKVVVAEINEKRRLLVTCDLKMRGKKVIKVYRDRFKIDNPFLQGRKTGDGIGRLPHQKVQSQNSTHCDVLPLPHASLLSNYSTEKSLIKPSVG